MNRKTQRVERLEKHGERFTHPDLLSDDELLACIFGHDAPELHAAQAPRGTDESAFWEMLTGKVRREIGLRRAR